MKKYRPVAANGVNGAAWLGPHLLSSQEQNCRGSPERQPVELIVPRAERSKLCRQGLPLPSQRFRQGWLLCLLIGYPIIREYHSANSSRTFVDSVGPVPNLLIPSGRDDCIEMTFLKVVISTRYF